MLTLSQREITECASCRGEIREGDEVRRVKESGEFVHEECAEEFAAQLVYDAEGTIDKNGGVV